MESSVITPLLAISTPVPLIDGPQGKRLPLLTMNWIWARQDIGCPISHCVSELRIAGKPIDEARNMVVAKAQAIGAKYLFFLDWDVLPPANTLVRLVYLAENNPEYDIFSGVYCLKRNPPEPLMWINDHQHVGWDWTVGDMLECSEVPTGCMLIRMSLFDRLDGETSPWFKMAKESHHDRIDYFTDDIWFCRRARKEADARILVDTSLQCGHIDNSTGIIYELPEDSQPWRRWREQQAKGNGEVTKELVHA